DLQLDRRPAPDASLALAPCAQADAAHRGAPPALEPVLGSPGGHAPRRTLPAYGVPADARAWPGAPQDASAAAAACRHAAHRPACSGARAHLTALGGRQLFPIPSTQVEGQGGLVSTAKR